jgi:glycosyltransferase involved in cell wall biosynthesis
MISISLCMIVKNEAKSIANCLDSVKHIVDEIVVVDTGSTDETKEIIRNYTDLIFDFQWIDDFSSARNYSFSHATKEYILWLDADDVLLKEDQQKLNQLKQSLDKSVDSVTMIYHYAFDEYGNVSFSLRRNRLVKRSKNFQWHGAVHEFLAVGGTILNSDVIVTHKRMHQQSGRNLSIYKNRLAKGESLKSRDLYYYANELRDQGKIQMAAEYYIQFLDGGEGWVEDQISACDKLADIYSQLGDVIKERAFIFKSFEYDPPRAELCCRLGYHFLCIRDYKNAAFWYELATKLEKPKDSWGLHNEACWTWLPHIQLCICYYHLGDYEKSYDQNEIARGYRPLDEHVLHNKNHLEKLLKNLKLKPDDSTPIDISSHKERPLRIVQIAPDIYPIPPKNYGGIEKVVYDLTEELVRRGHEVYVYAPKDSHTSGTLIPYEHSGIWNEREIVNYMVKTLPQSIDIIHDHTHYSWIGQKNLSIPTICTIHCTMTNPVKYPVYVSRRALEIYGGNYGFYVYNGLHPDEYEFSEEKDDYMLFLGRLDPSKGIIHALNIAEKTHKNLVIAGPVFDSEFYTKEVEPRIKQNENIKYVGEVGGKFKQDLLKKAKLVLFPSVYEEPFGLVMIEAMACGTPVIALANGAVPEVLKGFPECICQSVDDMVEKVLHAPLPHPQSLRDYVLTHFTTSLMCDGYLEIYEKILCGNESH